MKPEYEIIIGLEVHAQLKTDSKLFCGCSTEFGKKPNSQTCPVCLGHPGVLPVLNRKAFRLALRTACAFGCTIAPYTKFDRKHYYYPDLPKNFQISQYDMPFAHGGKVEFPLDGRQKSARLIRIHLEEDAGKLVHDSRRDISCVDLNRTGTPLMEIVSEPDITSPEEAYEYLNALKLTLKYLDVSDCNMQEGSLRCDANINIRVGEDVTPISEVKNLNSFRGVESALAYEAERQFGEYRNTGRTQKDAPKETVGWDADRGETIVQRAKEEAHDYRYFPEPDIPPLYVTEPMIREAQQSVCELPLRRKERFMTEMGLSEYDAGVLVQDKYLADYFEETCSSGNPIIDAKECANAVINDVLRAVKDTGCTMRAFPVPPGHLAGLLTCAKNGEISSSTARDTVFPEMVSSGKTADEIIREKDLMQIRDQEELSAIVSDVVKNNPKGVKDYLSGKKQAIGFLIGQVMKSTQGKADHSVVISLLEKHIGSGKEI